MTSNKRHAADACCRDAPTFIKRASRFGLIRATGSVRNIRMWLNGSLANITGALPNMRESSFDICGQVKIETSATTDCRSNEAPGMLNC